MRTSVTPLSSVELKVEVEVPASDVDREFRRQTARRKSRAQIKGFRKGKAPKEMVHKLFGGQIASDATQQLIQSTFGQALESVDRRTVGEPSVEPTLAKEGEALLYSIRIEVVPEFEVAHWRHLEIEVPPAEIGDELVDQDLQRRREQHKERVPVEERGADTGDIVVLDTLGAVAGDPDPRLDMTAFEVTIGAGQLIEGFEDQLMGAKPGDKRLIEVTFPEDYHATDLAGQPATFDATVQSVFFEELPDLDDDFAQDLNFDTVDALRADTRSRLQAQADDGRKQEIERRLVALLIERNPFDVPQAMLRAQFDGDARRMLMIMQMQGFPQDQAREMLTANLEPMRQRALETVKRYLLLEQLAKQEEIVVGDDALDAEIVKRLQQSPSGVTYDKDEQREGLRLEIRERQALDHVRTHAQITDAPAEPEPAADAEAGEDAE